VLDLLDSKVGEDADAAERLTARLKQATTGAIEGAVIDGLIAAIRAARTDEGLTQTIRNSLAGAGKRAEARIQERGTRMQSGVDPTAMTDEMIAAAGRAVAKPDAEKDVLGFVQKALEVTKNLQQKRGTAQQFLKRLVQNGVSEEEIQALGLRQKFSDPNEQITRDQFAQTIRDRRIELEETVKTTEPSKLAEGETDDLRFGQGEVLDDPAEWNYMTEDFINDLQQGTEPDTTERVIEIVKDRGRYNDDELARLKQQIEEGDFLDLPNSIQIEFEDAADDLARDMYFDNPIEIYRALDEDYEIIGNEDMGYFVRYEGRQVGDDTFSSLGEAEIQAREHAYNTGLLSDAGDFGEAKFEDYMLSGGENYREILLRDPGTPTGGFPSHWSEDDVIGHVLVKDRIDAQGNKTLYAEEVQSDFAQSARPSVAEKRRLEVNQEAIKRRQDGIEKLQQELDGSESKEKAQQIEQAIRDAELEIDTYLENIKRTNDEVAARAEKVGQTRFVKDTQQWLRPTLKRLIAQAIEGNYDTVSVPPFRVVHERWNDDYGDFYRKSVPNTLLKVAKQLDPNAKLEYSDLVDSAYPELREESARRGVGANANGLDRTPTIKITPKMREAYEEKGQSLFVPGAAVVIAGKLVSDQMKREENGNTN